MTLLICGVLCVILMKTVFLSGPSEAQAPQGVIEEAPSIEMQLAARAQALAAGDATAYDFKGRVDDLEASLRYGRRAWSEEACLALTAMHADPEADPEVVARLDAALARSLTTPRARQHAIVCPVRGYLDGLLGDDPALRAALKGLWDEYNAFMMTPQETYWLTQTLMRTRQRPQSPQFASWLRRCGMENETPHWKHCVALIRQLTPQQGRDILDMTDLHLRESPPKSAPELMELADTLGHVARYGEPNVWRTDEAQRWPSHGRDMRIAALFALCRATNSPDEAMAKVAAAKLSFAIGMVSRVGATDLPRWRETCQIAFGRPRRDIPEGADADGVRTVVPPQGDPIRALAVWSGVAGEAPRYDFRAVIDAGLCVLPQGRPDWACAAPLWQPKGESMFEELRDLFVETRYIAWGDEWVESTEVLLARPEKTFQRAPEPAPPEAPEVAPDDAP